MDRQSRIPILFVIIVGVFLMKFANAQQSPPGWNSRSFTYLNGILTSANPVLSPVANAFSAQNLPKYYSISVTGTASPMVVRLEGSLDNSVWSQIGSTNTYTGVYSTVAPSPMLYLRLRAATIPAGSSITATAVGVW